MSQNSSNQRQSALTGDSPLSDAPCCASSYFPNLHEARTEFDKQRAESPTGRPSKESLSKYLAVINHALQSVCRDLQRLSTSDACQNPEDHQGQQQPCTDG